MDQAKEILKKLIQYRFWIAVGIAALMPMVAYFAAAGSIKEETAKKEAEIKSAQSEVKQYESGTIPNPDWATILKGRTEVLGREVNTAWAKLYDRQKHLLDWPEEVEPYFREWGPKWPEGVDDAFVAQQLINYALLYPAEVDKTYKRFRPFDYEDGSGLVAAPAQQELLRPATFSPTEPPKYGKAWAAQQRLWIQRVVLDVVDQVNRDAEDWDGAAIKQITALEVASPKAQDQRSAAKGETLKLAPEILKPGETSAAETAAATSEASGMGMMGMGMMGGKGKGASPTEPEEVYFVEGQNASPAFQIAPVYVAVYIDQNRILDLFNAFRDSPMAIQVIDFEMRRPETRVQKPVKGENNPGFGYGGMMGGGDMILGGMGTGRGMMGMGGDMMGSYARSGMGGGGMSGGGMGGMMGMGRGMMGMGNEMGGYAAPAKKKGQDIKTAQIQKDQEAAKKQAEDEDETAKSDRPTLSDPYYYVVEVHIYGQARFYNPPPPAEPEPAPESAGEPAPTAGEPQAEAPGAGGEAAPAAEEPKADEPGTDPAPEQPAAPAAEETDPGDQPAARADAPGVTVGEPTPSPEPPNPDSETPQP